MGIVTISRQYGAGGEEVAEVVSKRMGFRIVSRSKIEKKVAGFEGIRLPESAIEEKAPGIIERLTSDFRTWKNLLIESLLFYAKEEDVLIIGRGSFEVLKDIPGILNILVTGKFELRTKYVSEREKISTLHAEEKIGRIDRERAGFLKYYFGVEWPDSSLFHLTVNPLLTGVDESALLIESLQNKISSRSDQKRLRKDMIQELHGIIASRNRITLSLGIDMDLFSIEVKEAKSIELKFFGVPPEQRDKAVSITSGLMDGYSVSQSE